MRFNWRVARLGESGGAGDRVLNLDPELKEACPNCGSSSGVMSPPCIECARNYCISCGLTFRQGPPKGLERFALPEAMYPIYAVCPEGHELGLSGDACDSFPIAVSCTDCSVGRVKGTQEWAWTCSNSKHIR